MNFYKRMAQATPNPVEPSFSVLKNCLAFPIHDADSSSKDCTSAQSGIRDLVAFASFFILIASSARLQAQNYNPNGFDAVRTMQEVQHPHSDLVLLSSHRGNHALVDGTYPGVSENSLAAIGLAAQAGIEQIELDIKLTSDGVPVLSHDITLGRETCPFGQPNLAFNPFLAEGSDPNNDAENPLVSSQSLFLIKNAWTPRDTISLIQQGPIQSCFSGPQNVFLPTLQEALSYMANNKIAMVIALDLRDAATAAAAWKVIATNKDFLGRFYQQSTLFKVPGKAFASPNDVYSTFSPSYADAPDELANFVPVFNTADIAPGAITDTLFGGIGVGPGATGYGSEEAIISAIQAFENDTRFNVATVEIDIKQTGGILTSVLAAARTNSRTGQPESITIFSPYVDYYAPSDVNRAHPLFFKTNGYCCIDLSAFFYNGAPNGQPSDTADNRGSLLYLNVERLNNLITDNPVNYNAQFAAVGLRNISHIQGGSGAQRSIVPLRVMPIGDSITEGYQSSPGQFGNGYRYPLQQDILNMSQTIQFVGDQSDGTMNNPQNEGFSGKEIAYIASQAVPSAASWRPNVALILAGTNDVNGNDNIASAPDRLNSMINGLFNSAPDATMLVAGLPPSFDSTFNTNLQAFNASVRALVSQRQNSGQHVQYVDMSNLDPNADKADSLHPNPAGYQIMGNNFAGAIEDVMNKGWVTAPVATNRTIGGGGGHGNGTPQGPLGAAAWQPLGPIASGIGTATGSITIMADLNGDGRADYLSVEPNGSVYGRLNGGANPAGGWIWLPQPEITSGGGALDSQVRFADINGDGRADFLAVAQNGSVTGYLNGGLAADGTWVWLPTTVHPGADGPGDEIQFADVNGDGKADYLIIDNKTGKVTMELNLGGGNWGPATVIASGTGAPAGSKFLFADINRDGFADYLTVSSIDGTVTAYMNGGVKADGTLNLYGVGQVAPGLGAPSLDLAVLFADLDGDGVADYLAVNRNTGGLNVSLTKGLDTSTVSNWIPLGLIAAGEGGPNIQIQFADIDGDGRADYLAVNTLNGSATGYLNGGQKQGGWIWYPESKIASGVGAQAGSTYRFADVNGDGKADYLVVGFLNSVTAYLSAGQGPDGWVYNPIGQIYAGDSAWAAFGAADAVHFADIDGDGYADLLVFNNGNVEGLFNSEVSRNYFDLAPVQTIAYSPGVSSNITLANIKVGDPKRADYLVIGEDGSVTALLNEGSTGSIRAPVVNWKSAGQIAAGTAPPGTSVIFADINGDGRADYLVVNNTTGAVTAWLNNGPY